MQAMACRFGYTNLEQPLQDIEEVLGEELGMEIIVTRFNLYLNQSKERNLLSFGKVLQCFLELPYKLNVKCNILPVIIRCLEN